MGFFRIAAVVAATIVCSPMGIGTVRGQTARQPNIVFIMADDLGWGELGCYGNTFNETPHLDRLASSGARFTQAYAAAPVCSPTRASIMTGQYPARVGITDFLPPSEKTDRFLDPAAYVTLNEALATRGYHTGIIGKWHLDTDFKKNAGGPAAHGFHEVIGSETKYIADGDYFFPYDKIATYAEGTSDEYLTDRQNSDACDFIRRNKDKPFFLYLSYYSVHTKLAAPQRTVNKYRDKFDGRYGKGSAQRIFEDNNPRHEGNHTDNPYLAAMLEHIDKGIGRIVETLEATGLAENTLIVFFSDNGGAGRAGNNGPLRSHKTWLYEGGIREPLLIRWPAVVKPGTIVSEPVISTDFYPTFVAAGGGDPQQYTTDGQNLLPLLHGTGRPGQRELYWHYPSETGKWKNRMSGAVRKGDYKLIKFYANNRLELYNLAVDVAEHNNLAEKEPAKAMEMKKLLDAWKQEVNAEEPVLPE